MPANTTSYLLITTNMLADNSKHAIYPSFTTTEVSGLNWFAGNCPN